jgi:hypothetical protein
MVPVYIIGSLGKVVGYQDLAFHTLALCTLHLSRSIGYLSIPIWLLIKLLIPLTSLEHSGILGTHLLSAFGALE